MMKKELLAMRAITLTMMAAMILLMATSFTNRSRGYYEEIDVHRINILEPDGTVKMIITNADRFPTGDDQINEMATNPFRKKRAGMLFFNEDGIEAGGFIFDGKKNENGHSSGLSLTFDQYDGDQVMQLLTTDSQNGDDRRVRSSLVFNDRPEGESQQQMIAIAIELEELKKSDPQKARRKQAQYIEQGLIGGVPRVMLGQSHDQNNGLFLFDDAGNARAMFFVDKHNKARLDFYDEKGNVVLSIPE